MLMTGGVETTITGLVQVPHTIVLDPKNLATIKSKLETDVNQELNQALTTLVAQADQWVDRWLNEGPWTVTKKSVCPPSGDFHDYMSQAPYWWPSNTPDKLPYVQRDGEINPETIISDKADLRKVFRSLYVLSLAWYYTRNEIYGAHASAILRAWFLAPETRMNPHLLYAQCIYESFLQGRDPG